MSTKHQIDGYHEIGKRSALICVVIGLVTSGCLALSSFIMPYYVSTPYNGYHINYYFDRVAYSPDITNIMPYSKCYTDSNNQNCSTLTNISTSIIILNTAAVIVITILCIFIIKRIVSTQKLITSLPLLCYVLGILCCWCLITASIHSFMKSFPNTKYCSYNGDGTGCEWFYGIMLLLSSTSVLVVLASVIIGIAVPFCRVFKFLPCFSENDDIDNDDGLKPQLEPINIDNTINEDSNAMLISNHYNPQKRRKICVYLSIPECCSIVILSIGLVLINIILILSYFNEWYPSNFESQDYVNAKWNNAECIQLDGYWDKPIIYDVQNDNQCSFSYPDSDGSLNGTFWSCCDETTCNKAFDYTQLMIGYEMDTDSESSKCLMDMKAITKASCHPNDKWFITDKFNISESPKQKESKLALCALFCKQTYDHCSDMVWSNQIDGNKTVQELWSKYDAFCEDGLGTEVRYEAFTDRCFAGCGHYKLYVSIFIVSFMIICV